MSVKTKHSASVAPVQAVLRSEGASQSPCVRFTGLIGNVYLGQFALTYARVVVMIKQAP